MKFFPELNAVKTEKSKGKSGTIKLTGGAGCLVWNQTLNNSPANKRQLPGNQMYELL